MLCVLSQAGELGLSQPWGYTMEWWLPLGAPAPPTKRQEWGMIFITPCITARAQNSSEAIPSNANKGVCSQCCYIFLPRTEIHSQLVAEE